MRRIVMALWLTVGSTLIAAEEPLLVQQFLDSGELSRGEQVLEAELAAHPQDDQSRFSLGVLQLVRAVERLGQALHEYGVKPTNDLFLRLPVPENTEPAVINYFRFRRMLDDFGRNLSIVEATLSKITDDNVRLPLKLADIHLDFDADGKPTDKFHDVLLKLFQARQFDFLKDNPGFLIVFDRGDVAWLRAYCHLLGGMLDLFLAFDGEESFDLWADRAFAKPKKTFTGDEDERLRKTQGIDEILIQEPQRLGRFRRHWIAVAELNHETWKHIRAETDDDHEWLPNPKQRGIFRLPVRDEMIDNWLAMMSEFQRLLEGERTFPHLFGRYNDDEELNLKTLLDDPPKKLGLNGGFPRNMGKKYFEKPKPLKSEAIWRGVQMFLNPATMGYPAWFN